MQCSSTRTCNSTIKKHHFFSSISYDLQLLKILYQLENKSPVKGLFAAIDPAVYKVLNLQFTKCRMWTLVSLWVNERGARCIHGISHSAHFRHFVGNRVQQGRIRLEEVSRQVAMSYVLY
jgi:hypothetical protein